MKTTPKTLILVIIAAVIIIATSFILILNWNNIFRKELMQPTRTVIIELEEDIESFKMKKIIRQNRDIVFIKENFSQTSDYQQYVTPNDPVITNYLETNSITTTQQAYSKAVRWIWVSDQILHNKPEYWMLPSAFIQDTPNDPDNPIPGSIVSDCESQAYTLVSLIEAIGTPKTNIRVVVGKVKFGDETGGHAWVQLYQDNEWFELEPTSGPLWDDEENKLVNNAGFTYNYFKTHPYPVIEYWAFFNDIYYYNPDNQMKSPDLPAHWLMTLASLP